LLNNLLSFIYIYIYLYLLKADVDGSGTLDCEEFVTMSVHLKEIDSDEVLSQAFSVFDKNRNGYIEFDELRETLVDDSVGSNNDQIIKDIIFDADLDKVTMIRSDQIRSDHPSIHPSILYLHELLLLLLFNIDLLRILINMQDGRISYNEFKAMMKTGMGWKMASRQYSRALLNALSLKLFNDKSMELKFD